MLTLNMTESGFVNSKSVRVVELKAYITGLAAVAKQAAARKEAQMLEAAILAKATANLAKMTVREAAP